ncbi:hypothetical protein BKA70DRAFT_1437387 [Coprinopsis sp. MPI-PUGE-AT-0042]|nr:hypothetical protein BKA70DRAFT_1437387 [Coprinopsis sp. MPI-PUGE-AT-0042]
MSLLFEKAGESLPKSFLFNMEPLWTKAQSAKQLLSISVPSTPVSPLDGLNLPVVGEPPIFWSSQGSSSSSNSQDAEGVLSLLSKAQASKSMICQIHGMPPAEVEVLMQCYGTSLMVYHLALEMNEISYHLLSHLDHEKDAVFGEGVWVLRNLHKLEDGQCESAERAMQDFDNVYFQEWRSMINKLFLSRFRPRSQNVMTAFYPYSSFLAPSP